MKHMACGQQVIRHVFPQNVLIQLVHFVKGSNRFDLLFKVKYVTVRLVSEIQAAHHPINFEMVQLMHFRNVFDKFKGHIP